MNLDQTMGLGTLLRRLLELLDGDVEAIYREDHPFYVPRFTPVMKALRSEEALSIKEIAQASGTTHSAASQTVSQMVKLGLVKLESGNDGRTRIASLTRAGRSLLPWLEQRWHATDSAAESLDRELSHPLSSLVAEAVMALERRPFATRIKDQ